MNSTIKRSAVLAVVLLILTMAAIFPASANDTPATLLALGDSLTTGYGLENYVKDGDPYQCASYINTLAASLGLAGGSTYINRAVNGATSADLAALLPSLEEQVKAADLIVISVGGNDLLQALPVIASMASGKTVTAWEQAIGVLSQMDAAGFEALQSNADFQAKMNELYSNMGNNLGTVAAYVQQTAPRARVIFLLQYNPMKGVPALGAFGDFAGTFIASINEQISAACTAYNYECIDVPSVIDHDALGLTNIAQNDIHPNAQGHANIAKLLIEYLASTAEQSTEVTTEEITEAPTTEAPTTEQVTEAPATDVITTEAQTDVPTKKSGCKGVIGGACVLIPLLAVAFVAKKKD